MSQVAVFQTLTAWNCEKGAEAVNSGALQFRNFVLVNNEKAGYEGKLIVNSPPQWDDDNGYGVFDSLIGENIIIYCSFIVCSCNQSTYTNVIQRY